MPGSFDIYFYNGAKPTQFATVPDAVGHASREDMSSRKTEGYQGTHELHAPTLILGTDALQHLHLYISYKEKKIYATAATPPAAPATVATTKP